MIPVQASELPTRHEISYIRYFKSHLTCVAISCTVTLSRALCHLLGKEE